MTTVVKKANGTAVGVPRRQTARLAFKLGRKMVVDRLPSPSDAFREVTERAREHGALALAQRIRSVPIQRSLDIAVPLQVAYDEWMKFDFLPEGAHRVEKIERDGDDVLVGRLSGVRGSEWEAEIQEERLDESFAWRSVVGSDCAGLVTFHRLGERLTRLELELDVVPVRAEEAVELMLRLADRRAEVDLRRFKARVEMISPDDYPPLEERADDDVQGDNHKEE